MKNDKAGFLSDRQYNFIKFLTVVLLPAVGTLYFGLSQTWGLPAGQEVLGTLMAIQIFIGAILGISTKSYNESDERFDGKIIKTETADKTTASLEFKDHPEEVLKKDEVTLKVESAK